MSASLPLPAPFNCSFAVRAIDSRARLTFEASARAAALSSDCFISSGEIAIGRAACAIRTCACAVSSTCGIVMLPPSASMCEPCSGAAKIGTRTWLPEKFLRFVLRSSSERSTRPFG